MPELPDVEVMRRVIAPDVRGRTVGGVTLNWPRAVKAPSAGGIPRRPSGCDHRGRGSQGEVFSIPAEGHPRTLIVHLRMTGSLRVVESSEEMHRYTQTVFHFEEGYDLRFVDMRKFGAVWLVDDSESVVGGLGPEPLESSFTPEVLEGIVEGRSTVIKSLLMDQKRIAGIGNIYADDILFRSGVHPQTPAKKLGAESIGAIHDSIVVILTRAIEMLTDRMPLDAPPTEAQGGEIFLVPRKERDVVSRLPWGDPEDGGRGEGDLLLSGLSAGGCCVDKCLMASEGDSRIAPMGEKWEGREPHP